MPGDDREWWHGSAGPLIEIRPFLHVGTVAQARMRAGPACHLTRIAVQGRINIIRMRDTGSWRKADLRRALSRKADVVVYLNRFEGIPLEEFDAARERVSDLDGLADAAFRRLVPSASDSLILLNPAIARRTNASQSSHDGAPTTSAAATG